jgi:hypothetical protein
VRELTDLELDILMILADNKGHALWELVELLGKEKSNLIITLNRLEEEIELTNTSRIRYHDLINFNSLALKFREPKDPLSQYIRSQFSPNTIRSLDPNTGFFDFLAEFELNKLLDDPELFEKERFAHIDLSKKIQEMIGKNLKVQELRCFNRLLLEEAYPESVLKGWGSLIYKGASRKTTNTNSRQPKHHEIPYFITANLLVLKFIIVDIDLARDKTLPKFSKEDKDKLEKMKEQVEWRQISQGDYEEFEFQLTMEMYDKANMAKTNEMYELFNNFLSSGYVLQFIKKFGFHWTIRNIKEMGLTWDDCWPLGKRALESGIIDNESDLECVGKLVRFHRDLEAYYERVDDNNKGREEDDEECY